LRPNSWALSPLPPRALTHTATSPPSAQIASLWTLATHADVKTVVDIDIVSHSPEPDGATYIHHYGAAGAPGTFDVAVADAGAADQDRLAQTMETYGPLTVRHTPNGKVDHGYGYSFVTNLDASTLGHGSRCRVVVLPPHDIVDPNPDANQGIGLLCGHAASR
jgi:hypothetical protein